MPANSQESLAQDSSRLHLAWRISIALTIAAGLFHLLNLIGPDRLQLGPAMVTPFRFFFGLSWLLLLAQFLRERRLPRPDGADFIVLGLAALFLFRGAFNPETFGTALNWIATGAGMFLLVRHGLRGARDVKLVLATLTIVLLALALFGLAEYAAKSNPVFNRVQIDVIGADKLIQAASQFYRIRSLVGHPGFMGAVMLAAMPLTMLVFWRRRLLLGASLIVMAAALFLTFSRGSWLIGALVVVPLLTLRARYWMRRNLVWIMPAALLPLVLITFNYFDREAVSIDMPGYRMQSSGLSWNGGEDGPVVAVQGESAGIQPLNRFIYFNVDDSFFRNGHSPVTVTIDYFDKGTGAIRIDYDSWDGPYKSTPTINKTDSRQWTTAAFFLPDPRFGGRMNGGADFRIVEQDNSYTVDHVSVQKGKLGLVSLAIDQWLSRPDSVSTRADLYPLAWGVLRDHPLGVGFYNSPGTDHHAVDSLPLTWVMEFGWPGLLLLAGIAWLFIQEGIRAWWYHRAVAAVLFMVLLVLMLHGWHLMILDDKPSLVLFATVSAVYAAVRPWRSGGAAIDVSNEDCML